MFTLILYVILAIAFGYFATENIQKVSVTFAGTALEPVSLFIIIGITFLIGLGFSWIASLFNSLSVALKIRGKETIIKNAKNTIRSLTKHTNDLEIENAKLTNQKDRLQDDKSL